jgi:hypothetical protein
MTRKEDFPNGARVTVNGEGAAAFVRLVGHSGTIVGRSDYARCVRVQWDHLKGPVTICIDWLKHE